MSLQTFDFCFYVVLCIKHWFMRFEITAFCFYLHFTKRPNFFGMGLYLLRDFTRCKVICFFICIKKKY